MIVKPIELNLLTLYAIQAGECQTSGTICADCRTLKHNVVRENSISRHVELLIRSPWFTRIPCNHHHR